MYKWLVIVGDLTTQKNLTLTVLSISDRVTFMSPGSESDHNRQTFVLTKIYSMKPVLAGEWKPNTGSWTLYSSDIFPEFRGLFGRNFVVATLPVKF